MPRVFYGKTTVLGIGVGFESCCPQVVESALAIFPVREEPDAGDASPSVYVVLNETTRPAPTITQNRICGQKLRVTHGGFVIEADGVDRRGICCFPVDARDGELFREAINTAVLFLVAQAGRIPVHASAVVIADCAVVLAGRSGAGKSVLALAADRACLPVLAEDTVFVQLEPALRVWGLAERVHVLEEDLPPGVRGETRTRSGRIKSSLPIAHPCSNAERAALCVLARSDEAILEPLSIDGAARELTRDLEPGYDFYGSKLEDAIRALAADSCWRLSVSNDPRAAIAALTGEFGGLNARRRSV